MKKLYKKQTVYICLECGTVRTTLKGIIAHTGKDND